MARQGKDKRQPTGDYRVGYAKPPEDSRFKPGHDPRRKGGRRAAATLDQIFLEEAARVIKVRVGETVQSMPKLRAIVRGLLDQSLKGNGVALRLVLGRLVAIHAERKGGDPAGHGDPLTSDELGVLDLLKLLKDEADG